VSTKRILKHSHVAVQEAPFYSEASALVLTPVLPSFSEILTVCPQSFVFVFVFLAGGGFYFCNF
jgi:hypothetical protein